MLYECAAHGTRVSSLEVEYIGWKFVGMFTHAVPVGAHWTSPNPLAALAVMDPDWPVVRSLIRTWNPVDVSPIATDNVSPECMNRSSLLLGVTVARVESTGLAG